MTITIEPLLRQPLPWYQPPSPTPGDVWMAPITTILSRRSHDGADPTADFDDWVTWYRGWKQTWIRDVMFDWRMKNIPWRVVLHDCRSHVDTFLELTESIATIGIVRPLSLLLEHGEWQLYDGHHRLTAAIDLGLHAVPVRAIDEREAALAWRGDDRIITI